MNILTFDIEDWFHILDNKSSKGVKEWSNYETRIYNGIENILSILDNCNVKATFFVLGWIAEKYPDIIKKISKNGYQIGSHSHLHQLAYDQSYKEFKNDTEKSIKTLEDITGVKVDCYRAPGFSIKENNKWAFEVLYEMGIRYDSSIFPAKRSHGGMPKLNVVKPFLLTYNGSIIKEFPINPISVFGKSIIFSGGGYFRLFPYKLIKKFSLDSEYIMTYFHPRDFDINQPLLKGLSIYRIFKSYYGIKGCEKKLLRWINDFKFTDLKTAEKSINWDKVKTINF